jgi:hypothetical protein
MELHKTPCLLRGSERSAMNNETWLKRLNLLLNRFSHLGLDADIAALSIVELRGLYCYLSRLADG